MSDRHSAARASAQTQVGDLGTVKVWMNKAGVLVYMIHCRTCEGRTPSMRWTTRSDPDVHGSGSTRANALDQWQRHIEKRHPLGADADPDTRLPPHLR